MASPASPRLPSPPPIPEDQLSPVPASPEQQKFVNNLDHGAHRRIRPGTKAEDMAEGPPLVELSEIDSAFQLTEHLKALHNSLTHPAGLNSTMAVDKDMAITLAQSPDSIDRTLWLYELCRFLTQKVNSIIVALFSDSPACSSTTCPEMRASEWQYLCAVHDPPKSCCAIDYCCHTLDWAANTLTSPKHFPSRLALGTDQSTQHSQMRQLTNIFRRVYRIFAHAWFQHRDMFWKVEGRTGLYVLFKTVCDAYGLIPEDNYTIPMEAEGVKPTSEPKASMAPLLLKREAGQPGPQETDTATTTTAAFAEHSLSTAGTTKRHRHSPSVGATAVHTVVEENEEEEEAAKAPSGPPPVSAPTQDGEIASMEEEEDAQAGQDAAGEVRPAVAPATQEQADEPSQAKLEGGERESGQASEASPVRIAETLNDVAPAPTPAPAPASQAADEEGGEATAKAAGAQAEVEAEAEAAEAAEAEGEGAGRSAEATAAEA